MVLEVTAFWGGGLVVSFALTSLSVGKTLWEDRDFMLMF